MNLSATKINYFSCFAYLAESVYFEINVALSCYTAGIRSRHLCVWIRISVPKNPLLLLCNRTSAATRGTAAAEVQLWLFLGFRGAGREERNVFQQFSHAAISSQLKESN